MNKILIISAVCVCCLTACNSAQKNEAQQQDAPMPNTEWTSIAPEALAENAVSLYRDAMALAVGTPEHHNAMTIAWGGLGVLYNRPVVTVYVSSSRYTYEFMEQYETFTISAFPDAMTEQLMYLGRHSGRDSDDKIRDAGLSIEFTDLGNIRFHESNLCIECRLIYKEELKKDALDPEVAKFYDNGAGMHSMYIGEIVRVWKKG